MRRSGMEPGAADPGLVARLAGALEGREEVLEAYLSGSRAQGRQRPESDVDVAVYVDGARAEDGRWGYRAMLTTELMTALEADDVDVVALNRAPALLYHRVPRDGVLLLSRDLRATTTRAGRRDGPCGPPRPPRRRAASRRPASGRGRPAPACRRVGGGAPRRLRPPLGGRARPPAMRAERPRRRRPSRRRRRPRSRELPVGHRRLGRGRGVAARFRGALPRRRRLPQRARAWLSGRRSGIGRPLPRRGPRRLRGVRPSRRTMARRSPGPVSRRRAADARTRPTGGRRKKLRRGVSWFRHM